MEIQYSEDEDANEDDDDWEKTFEHPSRLIHPPSSYRTSGHEGAWNRTQNGFGRSLVLRSIRDSLRPERPILAHFRQLPVENQENCILRKG